MLNINETRPISNEEEAMESFIKEFGSHTDEPTKVMLQNVYKHKVKFDQYKRKLIICTWTSLLVFLIMFYYISNFIIEPNSSNAYMMFAVIVSDSIVYILIGILVFLSGVASYFKKKKEKHEKEFQDLRKEIVQKSPLQWRYPFDWEKRNEVFAKMKEVKDINLYHENK
jgi:LPXTG-motif cell wall-anchored protein